MRTAEEEGGGACAGGETISSGYGDGTGRTKKGGWGRVGDFQRDLVAGAVMGGLVHTVVAPIERAKLLLQTQESNAAILGLTGHPRKVRFRGMVDCIVRTVREEGVLSLWRGNGTSVLRYYPSVALNFSLKAVMNNREGLQLWTT
ncbi:probable ADP,ATP carrier protein At5g56450 [Dendrobium catenatum]|uniref:probable ADP,ATP carrier protein At5g56450 n=1 Tax=Dendrobium catenatum TaxID=906689 RepID=UPI0009F59769|nr:probable ADP,ATP carrier protein At5g56450 [Dendrobium catenatum]